MTHYVGIVEANSVEEIDDILAPYSEDLEIPEYKIFPTDEEIKKFLQYYTGNQFNPNLAFYIYLYGKNWDDWILNEDLKPIKLSTDNPKAKYDWYEVGGRWGNLVTENSCLAKEVKDFFSEYNYLPSVYVNKEEWFEEEKFGWFGISIEIKENKGIVARKLEENSEEKVFIVDFHI